MAAKDTTSKTAESKAKADDHNTGTPNPESTDTADVHVARAAGISEGDVKALRDEAGLNQSAGHEMDLHAWASTEAGKQFAKEASEREKKEKEFEKSYSESFNKDGLNKAEVKYREAVEKA